MTRFLLDTDVISQNVPGERSLHSKRAAWVDEHWPSSFISVVTISEIERGIAKLRRRGSRARAHAFEEWLELVLHLYSDRVVPLDLPAARMAGALMDLASSKGHTIGYPDLAIAATAASRGLTLATRNVRHFRPLGVAIINPVD